MKFIMVYICAASSAVFDFHCASRVSQLLRPVRSAVAQLRPAIAKSKIPNVSVIKPQNRSFNTSAPSLKQESPLSFSKEAQDGSDSIKGLSAYINYQARDLDRIKTIARSLKISFEDASSLYNKNSLEFETIFNEIHNENKPLLNSIEEFFLKRPLKVANIAQDLKQRGIGNFSKMSGHIINSEGRQKALTLDNFVTFRSFDEIDYKSPEYTTKLYQIAELYLQEVKKLEHVIEQLAVKHNLSRFEIEKKIFNRSYYRGYSSPFDYDGVYSFDIQKFYERAIEFRKITRAIKQVVERNKKLGLVDELVALERPSYYNGVFDFIEKLGVDLATAEVYFQKSKGEHRDVIALMEALNISFYEALHEVQTKGRFLGEKTVGAVLTGIGLATGVKLEEASANTNINSPENIQPAAKHDAALVGTPQAFPAQEVNAVHPIADPGTAEKLEQLTKLARLRNFLHQRLLAPVSQGFDYTKSFLYGSRITKWLREFSQNLKRVLRIKEVGK